MKIQRAFRLLAVASVAAIVAAPALSQDDAYNYGGFGIGTARSNLDDDGLLGLPTLGSIADLRRDRRDTGWRIFGGRQFNSTVGIEGGYFDLGRFGFAADTQADGTVSGRQRVQGLNLDLVGTLPVTENFAVLGRVGAVYSRARGSAEATAPQVRSTSSSRGAGIKAGVGLQYAFSPAFLVRGELERYQVRAASGSRGNVDVASVSAVFPFGRAPTTARRSSAPAPTYAAQTPAPAPAPVMAQPEPPAPPPVAAAPAPAPVATAPEPRRFSYEAASMFGFDAATLRSDGRQDLDRFASQLEGARYDTVRVEGHTDRLGSADYNQALSERRAEAVKEHLVRSGGIDESRISAVGRGQTQPVTNAADCAGTRRTPQLENCLQPDRRVEIEVSGTR